MHIHAVYYDRRPLGCLFSSNKELAFYWGAPISVPFISGSHFSHPFGLLSGTRRALSCVLSSHLVTFFLSCKDFIFCLLHFKGAYLELVAASMRKTLEAV
jgi:hypothetical protein